MPFTLNGTKISVIDLAWGQEELDESVREMAKSVPWEDVMSCLKEVNAKIEALPKIASKTNLIRYDFEIKDGKIAFLGGYLAGLRVVS